MMNAPGLLPALVGEWLALMTSRERAAETNPAVVKPTAENGAPAEPIVDPQSSIVDHSKSTMDPASDNAIAGEEVVQASIAAAASTYGPTSKTMVLPEAASLSSSFDIRAERDAAIALLTRLFIARPAAKDAERAVLLLQRIEVGQEC